MKLQEGVVCVKLLHDVCMCVAPDPPPPWPGGVHGGGEGWARRNNVHADFLLLILFHDCQVGLALSKRKHQKTRFYLQGEHDSDVL